MATLKPNNPEVFDCRRELSTVNIWVYQREQYFSFVLARRMSRPEVHMLGVSFVPEDSTSQARGKLRKYLAYGRMCLKRVPKHSNCD